MSKCGKSTSKKRNSAEENIASIMREQHQLLKMESEIKKALVKLNECINELKVEELQIRANAVVQDIKSTSNITQAKNHTNHGFLDDSKNINKQNINLDLDLFAAQMFKGLEEDSNSD